MGSHARCNIIYNEHKEIWPSLSHWCDILLVALGYHVLALVSARDDTIAQFMQSSGYHFYYTQHPLFDTLVFGFFWELGFALHHVLLGLGIYVLVQTFSFAIGVMLVLCYLRKIGAARSLFVGYFSLLLSCPAYCRSSSYNGERFVTHGFSPTAINYLR
ncbi:MAG: hypothetical protein ACLUA4_00775 [Bifidobacterium sp.]